MLIRSNLKGHSNKGCLRPGETIIDYTVVTEPMFFLKQDFLTMGQFTHRQKIRTWATMLPRWN